MNEKEKQAMVQIKTLFDSQSFAVLSTHTDPSTALICVRIDTFFVVTQFQNVVKIKVYP